MPEDGQWEKIEEIVQRALDLPPDERALYVAEVCAGDDELRTKVETLLAVSESRVELFENLHISPSPLREIRLSEGDEVGPYRILRLLKPGGMGVVYLAYDIANDRNVALKISRPGVQRLSQEERRILARFNNSGIATLYASGETPDGLAYFAMEYVEGEPITTYCDAHKLDLRARLALFEEVCHIVADAHAKRIVHRDLKPGNILITAGAPKLLDFGIAKVLSSATSAIEAITGRTEDQAFTLAFASPEQLAREPTVPATDVYSLGVLLSVLLTGRLPYPVTGMHDLPWAIRNAEPVPPSKLLAIEDNLAPPHLAAPPAKELRHRLSRRLQGDLDAIVLKALQKEPDRRYRFASDLAEDIERHLSHKPVLARKGSLPYRAGKFIRRFRLPLAAAVLLLGGLVGFIFTLLSEQRATLAERNRAEAQAERAEQVSRFLVDLFRLPDPRLRPGNIVTARELLDKATKEVPRTLRDQPETQVYLLNTQGEVYKNLGLLDDAEKCHSQALKIASTKLGSASLGAADALFFLGVVRGAQGKYGDSERLHQRALKIRQRHLPADHPGIADSIYNLGVAATGQHQYEKATQLYNQALALQRANPKPDRRAIGKYLNALGNNYIVTIDAKQLPKAEQVLREALRIQKATYGEVHPEVAVTLNNLAVVLENNQRFDEAETLQRRALSISRKLLGDNHPDVVIALSNLAFLQYTKGDPPQAAETFRESLKASRLAFGNDHPDTLSIMVNLARTVSDCGHPRDGDRLLAEAYNTAMHAAVKDYSVIGNILKTQAQSLVLRKRFREAEARAREAVAALSKSEGPNSYPVAMTMAEVASSVAEQKRFKEAEPLLLEYLEVSIERDKADAYWRLARLYELWGKKELSAKYEQLLAKQRSIH